MTATAVPRPQLEDFEGLPVRQVGAEIPSLAGGLRDAVKVDPVEYHQGDEVAIIVRARCGKVRFEPIDPEEPDGDQRRVHVWQPSAVMIADVAAVDAVLSDYESRLAAVREAEERAKREKDGTPQLTDDDKFRLAEEHAAGKHADGLVDDCEVCDTERAALDEEARANGSPPPPEWGPGSKIDD